MVGERSFDFEAAGDFLIDALRDGRVRFEEGEYEERWRDYIDQMQQEEEVMAVASTAEWLRQFFL